MSTLIGAREERGATALPLPERRPDPGRPVSICIVNHNGEREIEGALEAVAAHAPRTSEVLVIDNASDDRSVALVRESYPDVRIVALGENRGPGAARNAGLEAASHDMVLFLDNDVRLTPGCVEQLVGALEAEPRAMAAMPCVLYEHDDSTVQYSGADSHYLGMMALRDEDRPIPSSDLEPRPIGSLVTACFLIDRAKERGTARFDERFFIYFEDHDFALRMRARDREILSVPAARCLHREGTPGLSLRRTGVYAPTRVFCLIRNRWLLLLKNYQARTLVALAPILAVYEAFQLAGVIKRRWHREWLRAVGWMIRNAPSVLASRRETQRLRRTGDRALLQGGAVPFHARLARSPVELAGKELLDRISAFYWRLVGPWI